MRDCTDRGRLMGPHPAVADVRRAVRDALDGVDGARVRGLFRGRRLARAGRRGGVRGPAGDLRAARHRRSRSAGEIPGRRGRPRRSAASGLGPAESVASRGGRGTGGRRPGRPVRRADAPGDASVRVLLGHTRDDQAETVLLGLGRGSGPRSVAGMRPRDGDHLRPFLDVARATTEAACAALGLPVERPAQHRPRVPAGAAAA